MEHKCFGKVNGQLKPCKYRCKIVCMGVFLHYLSDLVKHVPSFVSIAVVVSPGCAARSWTSRDGASGALPAKLGSRRRVRRKRSCSCRGRRPVRHTPRLLQVRQLILQEVKCPGTPSVCCRFRRLWFLQALEFAPLSQMLQTWLKRHLRVLKKVTKT